MKALLILDIVLALFGGVMAIAVGFVAFIYLLYMNDAPRLREGVSSVTTLTLCFIILFALAGAATLGIRRGQSWHWPLQLLLLISLPVLFYVASNQLRSP